MDFTKVEINLGDSGPYLDLRIREFFGTDPASIETAQWLASLQATAFKLASFVHCIGTHTPIPFYDIYQPTRLVAKGWKKLQPKAEAFTHQSKLSRSIEREKETEEQTISIRELMESGHDAIISAGPGWGKTTFLHHVYRLALSAEKSLPILITLRRTTAVSDLERFVEQATKLRKLRHKPQALLLVDGYDELTVEHRHRVSDAILRYTALGIGPYYLTCRDFYPVFLLAAQEVRIDRFDRDEKRNFVRTFLTASGSQLDPDQLVDELEQRGFSEFLSHPLLLMLACIVKTGSGDVEPRNVLRLLERALEILCYRWDDDKGVTRHRVTPLDGKDRLKILKRIAYIAKSPHLSAGRAEAMARQQLAMMSLEHVDAHQVLVETAQFYGILVPCEEGWEFVHRTLHDFLAAQFWVETGGFARSTSYEWNSRTAYAACASMDAAPVIMAALASEDGIPTVAEILSNSPDMDKKKVAEALIAYFAQPGRIVQYDASGSKRVVCMLNHNFVRLANSRFLNILMEKCATNRSVVNDALIAACLIEIHARQLKLDFATYALLLALYHDERFTFQLIGFTQVQLGFLNPGTSTGRS